MPENFEIESGFITSIRHERLLREALDALRRGHGALGQGLPHEMLLVFERPAPAAGAAAAP